MTRNKTDRRTSDRAVWVVSICAAVAAAVLLGIPVIGGLLDAAGGKLPEQTVVSGISIGGQTRAQAIKTLDSTVGACYRGNDMVVTLRGHTLRITPQASQITLDAQALVDAAFEGKASELEPYVQLNGGKIRSLLREEGAQYGASYSDFQYRLTGSSPALDEAHFDENAPCPVLELTLGTSGYALDEETLYNRILEAYTDGYFTVDGSDLVTEKVPEAPDLEQLREQACTAAVNASLNPDTRELIPGSYGLDFDLSEAQKQLNEAAPGQTLQIPLAYTAPEVMGQEAYFKDVLGFCQTPHNTNEKRNNNLRLACATLNGVVLQPGEILSYNETLGERTKERGYLPAPAYSGTNLVDTPGGGICQVSSTLYLSAMYAELEIVDRVSHGYPASYIPIGLDATVSWGKPDLKIQNNRDYPIKIVAEECDGFVRVWIMGTETRDYYVRMAFGSSSDRYAKSYVCKYDCQTDELLSKEDGALSSYLSISVYAKGEIGSNEAYINGNVREQPPCAPTPETLEASRDYKQPNQNG